MLQPPCLMFNKAMSWKSDVVLIRKPSMAGAMGVAFPGRSLGTRRTTLRLVIPGDPGNVEELETVRRSGYRPTRDCKNNAITKSWPGKTVRFSFS